ncbi:response regulator transcription factor [Neobacillus sp. D3-1R]|uniref:response regulator transcription factor n=1 Tax=Neobacillus sp. D3-1R TaxID=3445778 RepID=UPI003FA0C3A5
MRKKILIIEDEIRISNLLKMYLERENFFINIKDNGDAGLTQAIDEEYDLIILDVLMPGKDGFTVLEELRKRKNTPVIMLSAKGGENDIQHAYDLGVNQYILKPFSPKDVITKIKEMLA